MSMVESWFDFNLVMLKLNGGTWFLTTLREEGRGRDGPRVCSRCNTCLCVCMSYVECNGFSYCWDYYGVQVRKEEKREIEGSQ